MLESFNVKAIFITLSVLVLLLSLIPASSVPASTRTVAAIVPSGSPAGPDITDTVFIPDTGPTLSISPISTPPPVPTPPPIDLSPVIDGEGVIQEDVNYSTADGKLEIDIPTGTVALTGVSEPLQEITVEEVCFGIPAPQPGAYIIGCVYNLLPDGSTFNPWLEITMTYDPGMIPQGIDEEQLVIANYQTPAGEWSMLPSTVDTFNNSVTANPSGFSMFAVYAQPVGYRDIPLNVGWNLIGLSLIPADSSIEAVLAGVADNVISVWGYDTGNPGGPWSSWAPGWGGDLTDMVDSMGYWINMSAADTLRVEGYSGVNATGDKDVPLNGAWNLMSVPITPDDSSIEAVLADVADNVISVWGYDTTSPGGPWSSWAPGWGGELTDMADNIGYWVNMKAADTLTVAGTSGLSYD